MNLCKHTGLSPTATTRALLAVLLLLLVPGTSVALESRFDPADFRVEDEPAAREIAIHPAAVRRAALVVAGYPEMLLEIQEMQRRSAERFAELVAPYPRDTQEQIWNLVRYPGLAADLAREGRKSTAELEGIAERYPAEDRAAIVEEGLERYPLWVQIRALDLEAEQTFSALLSDRPDTVRDAFGEVIDRPDLMTLLVENIRVTTLLGALYREDPQGVEARFETLHAEVAAGRQEEQRAWAEELQDPAASEELERAAREFAEDHDYDYARAAADTRTIRVEHHVNVHPYPYRYPYPYWFGYPSWYDVAWWYPFSFWGHVGFRIGGGYGYVSYGLPSPLFLGWYHDIYVPRYHLARRSHHHRDLIRSIHYYDTHRPRYTTHHRRHRSDRARSGGHRLHSDSRSAFWASESSRRFDSRDATRAAGPRIERPVSRETLRREHTRHVIQPERSRTVRDPRPSGARTRGSVFGRPQEVRRPRAEADLSPPRIERPRIERRQQKVPVGVRQADRPQQLRINAKTDRRTKSIARPQRGDSGQRIGPRSEQRREPRQSIGSSARQGPGKHRAMRQSPGQGRGHDLGRGRGNSAKSSRGGGPRSSGGRQGQGGGGRR